MLNSLIHSSCVFKARRRREQQAKHNAKDDARPSAKVAYHRMNELLEEDSNEEDGENKKLSCLTMKTTLTVTTTMTIVL